MGYSYQGTGICAKAFGRSLPLSEKQSIEICSAVRNKPLSRAKKLLQRVIAMKEAIPFKRFTEVGHRSGAMTAGRYPVNACNEILALLESAEANAQAKGLNVNDLIVRHIAAQKAPLQWHYGRQYRRRMKRIHIEVVLEEQKPKGEKKLIKKGTS